MNYTKATIASVDLDALSHNIIRIRHYAPSSKVMAIIKANAYGHGLAEIATHSQHVDAFGVARIEEALKLRSAGINTPILLLEGFYSSQDLSLLVKYQLQTVIHCQEQLEIIEQTPINGPIDVWLKVDTGMHRLGIQAHEFLDYSRRLQRINNINQPLTLISHFGCADDLQHPMTLEQIAAFNSLSHTDQRSLAASAGIVAWPQSHFDWVRAGILLYGISPFADQIGADLALKPVMTLTSRIIAIRPLKKGQSVGYGARWKSPRDTNIGVIAIGYGEGYPRSVPDGTPVLINKRIVPLAGRISMDMLTVDLGPQPQEKVGDQATLWGEGLPIEKIAQHVGTIPYELITGLTSRVQYVYKQNGAIIETSEFK